MTKPIFTHDCDTCKFLGTYEGCDLYCHTGAGEPTVIARFGNDGPDYTSGIVFAPFNPLLGEALKRANAQGLLVEHL